MQSSVEATGALERKLSVQIPAQEIEKRVEERLATLSRRAKIKGFRPGKVPYKVVAQQYGIQVRQEVIGDLLQDTYARAVVEQNLRPAGFPKIEPESLEPGKDLKYVATFEVYPEIELKTIEGLKVHKDRVAVTEADIDVMLDRLRKQHITWTEVDRPAQLNDKVIVDFSGTLNGEPFAGGKAENTEVVIGGGRMLPAFEQAFIGHSAGDEFEFDLAFPEDYQAEDLKGKTPRFAVKLHKVEAGVLPELDDSFAQSLGMENVQDLRSKIRENMEREAAQTIQSRIKEQVLTQLYDANAVMVPNALIDDEINRMRQDMSNRMGIKPEQAQQLPKELFAQEAQKRVALGLLVAELIKTHNIQLDQDRVREVLQQLTADSQQPEELARAYMANEQARQAVEGMAIEQQVVDWLLERAEVVETDLDFTQFMNARAQTEAAAQD